MVKNFELKKESGIFPAIPRRLDLVQQATYLFFTSPLYHDVATGTL